MGVMSVAYTTINGDIVSEKRNGVPSDYIPDDLGSTIGLLSDTHQVIDTWTYWPYGEVRTHTGTSITPFTFVGTAGYHSDLVGNFTYVGARELRLALTRWQTVDSLWPPLLPCAYADCNPISVIDMHFVPTSCSWLNLVERFFADTPTKRSAEEPSTRSPNSSKRSTITLPSTTPIPYLSNGARRLNPLLKK